MVLHKKEMGQMMAASMASVKRTVVDSLRHYDGLTAMKHHRHARRYMRGYIQGMSADSVDRVLKARQCATHQSGAEGSVLLMAANSGVPLSSTEQASIERVDRLQHNSLMKQKEDELNRWKQSSRWKKMLIRTRHPNK